MNEPPPPPGGLHRGFVVLIFNSPQIHLHTSNLCNGNLFLSFRATLYPCPDTAAERREMAIGVNTRIEDLQHVSTLYGKCLLHC